jgi:DNA-directed RNA polymerase subunit RPC12/RpoP
LEFEKFEKYMEELTERLYPLMRAIAIMNGGSSFQEGLQWAAQWLSKAVASRGRTLDSLLSAIEWFARAYRVMGVNSDELRSYIEKVSSEGEDAVRYVLENINVLSLSNRIIRYYNKIPMRLFPSYECVRCGSEIPTERLWAGPDVKCPECGFRILKSRPSPADIERVLLKPYNEFVEKDLQQIINSIGGVAVPASSGNLYINFGEVGMGYPRVVEPDGSFHEVTPFECRVRGLTYEAPLFLDITPVFNGKIMAAYTVYIGDVPVMLKSEICPLSKMTGEELLEIREDPSDLGGYFIINGLDRIIAPEHFITAVLAGFGRLWNYWVRRMHKFLEKRPRKTIRKSTIIANIRPSIMHNCIHRTFEAAYIGMSRLGTNEYAIFETLSSLLGLEILRGYIMHEYG